MFLLLHPCFYYYTLLICLGTFKAERAQNNAGGHDAVCKMHTNAGREDIAKI